MSFDLKSVGGSSVPATTTDTSTSTSKKEKTKSNPEAKTGVGEKVKDAKFKKVVDLASFVENSSKLKAIRTEREGEIGIYKSIFKRGEKQEAQARQDLSCHFIKHYKFTHDKSDTSAVKAWLMCALDASPKDQKVMYDAIRHQVLDPNHQVNPYVLKGLNELASRDSRIQSMRDDYLQKSLQDLPSNTQITRDEHNAIYDRLIRRELKNTEEWTKMLEGSLEKLHNHKAKVYANTVEVWFDIADKASPKTQQALYSQIGAILKEGDHVSRALELLNQKAGNNPQIAAIRNAYVDAQSDSITKDFSSNLTKVLNGSMEAKIKFIEQFEGNQSLGNKNTVQIRHEQVAIKALLEKDDLTPSNRVLLQQLSLAYEIKLNENNPTKMLELAVQFIEAERPLLDKVVSDPSQTQIISAAAEMTQIAARICNATFPRTTEGVKVTQFKTKDEASLKIYGNHTTQVIMRFNTLMKEMQKGENVKQVANELQGYISQVSSNTKLYMARVEKASIEELRSFNTTGLVTAQSLDFDEFDRRHGLK
ncbi:MAG: hypothetical protein LBE99_01680 [Puniceicoccales bacterium]|jgi:hypothetical protein|nr:hypothetical protein [Puniceicoccales bacterium]